MFGKDTHQEEAPGKASAKAVVKNTAGIHCRPTAVIVKEARRFEDVIEVTSPEGMSADPKSAIELLSLGLEKGAEVGIDVKGATAEACCRKLVELFETEFDFPPRPKGEQSTVDDLMA